MGKCSKDKRDIFYRLAKKEGWRARSAFKLLQIDEKFNIFKDVKRAVDLCAAPGSWSQVLARHLGKDAKIVAVDIQTMAPIDGVIQITGDITSVDTANRVIDQFRQSDKEQVNSNDKAQLVICDGAPDVTGQHDLDEHLQAQLLLSALNITTYILEEGGTFIAKIFRGRDIKVLISQLSIFFKRVIVVKPSSSRTSSIESFVVCSDFSLPKDYEPRMFSTLTNIETDKYFSDLLQNNPASSSNLIVPFLICGDMNGLDPDKVYSIEPGYVPLPPTQPPITPPYETALSRIL